MKFLTCPNLDRLLLAMVLLLPTGCAVQSASTGGLSTPDGQQIEVGFSPEAGAEALVLKVIGSARQSVRLAGYSFSSPNVVRALVDARKRGVDVKVLVDDRGNRAKANVAAMNLIAAADIPIKVIATYAIHHDKYIVVDARHTETGSFNYSQAAARSNSENALVVWNNPKLAADFTAHWDSRWAQGVLVEMSY